MKKGETGSPLLSISYRTKLLEGGVGFKNKGDWEEWN